MDPVPAGNATVVAIVTFNLLMLVAGPGRAQDRFSCLVIVEAARTGDTPARRNRKGTGA